MGGRRIVTGLALAAAIAGVFACDRPDSRLPTSPSPPAVSRLEIVGPDTLAPGQSVQYDAVVRLSDGTTKIAGPGSQATWRASSSALDVDASGVATSRSSGDVTISVSVAGYGQAAKEVVIVPDGTYRLIGTVSDAEFPELAVAGANVEVWPGPLAATTGSDGVYRLYGVAPDSRLTVTAPGYAPVDRSITLPGHAVEHVSLTPSDVRASFTGRYTLAIDADAPCDGSLSEDHRHRRYGATIVQQGRSLDVVLTEPQFVVDASGRGNRFRGTVAGTTVRFTLGGVFFYYFFYYYLHQPDLAELLPDNTVLVPAGEVTATLGADGSVRGVLSGSMTQWRRMGSSYRYASGCFAPSIRFTLIPR